VNAYINAYIISTRYTSTHFHMRNTTMNTLNFAIGSIVDVNPGNGLVHNDGIRDNVAREQHGRENRAISVTSLIVGIKTKLPAVINRYRARVK
jgi:hypothetical protein